MEWLEERLPKYRLSGCRQGPLMAISSAEVLRFLSGLRPLPLNMT